MANVLGATRVFGLSTKSSVHLPFKVLVEDRDD